MLLVLPGQLLDLPEGLLTILRQVQRMRPPIRRGSHPLDPAAPLQLIEHAHEPRRFDADRLRDFRLGQARIGFDDCQN